MDTTTPSPFFRQLEEESEAQKAQTANARLLQSAQTEFKVDDIVKIDDKWVAKLTGVHPAGFITEARKYAMGFEGALLPAVICEVDTYQYEGRSSNGPVSGQATASQIVIVFNYQEG